jgi:hypothetical protein
MAVSIGCKNLPSGQKFEPNLCSLPKLNKNMKDPFKTDKEIRFFLKY